MFSYSRDKKRPGILCVGVGEIQTNHNNGQREKLWLIHRSLYGPADLIPIRQMNGADDWSEVPLLVGSFPSRRRSQPVNWLSFKCNI